MAILFINLFEHKMKTRMKWKHAYVGDHEIKEDRWQKQVKISNQQSLLAMQSWPVMCQLSPPPGCT